MFLKKFIFLPALLLTISSFASPKLNNLNVLLLSIKTPPCTVSVTQSTTTTVVCPNGGPITTAFVQVTGSATDVLGDCTTAYYHANEDATFKLSQAVTAKQAELLKSCPVP